MVGKKGTLIIILGIAGLLLIGGLVVIAALQSKDFLIVRSPLLIRETPLVTFVEGDCFHRDNPEGEWIEAKVGDKILRGYQIRTQRSAKVDIRLYKDTVVRITEDSLLTLDELTLKKLTLNLAEGQLYGRFHRIFKDQSLNIRTPTTVAAVRGTQLAFEIRGRGRISPPMWPPCRELPRSSIHHSPISRYCSLSRIKHGSERTAPPPLPRRWD